MFRMKYIILGRTKYVGERPYIFSELDQHVDVAILMVGEMCSQQLKDMIVGAGFVSHTRDGMQCWGRSESLDVDSRPEEDSKLINRFFDIES